MEPTSPIPRRSSGTNEWRTPSSLICAASYLARSISSPSGEWKMTLPDESFVRPAMASNNSFCPLPEIPATPSTSPPNASKDTFSRTCSPSSFVQVMLLIVRRFFKSCGIGRLISRETFSPTIISVRDSTVASEVCSVPIYFPFLRIATRSDNSNTSFSLCVIIIIALPSSLIFLRTSNSLSTSCGVSTAVGSSRIKIFAPR